MQILHTFTSPGRRKFWRSVRRRTRKGKRLTSFLDLGWLRQTRGPWDDDARLRKSDTALRQSLVGTHKPNSRSTIRCQVSCRTGKKPEELQAVEEFLQISVLKKGN